MDLSSIRTALNGFSSATPVMPGQKGQDFDAGVFLLGESARIWPAQPPVVMDLARPKPSDVTMFDDMTQEDGLEIDYACDGASDGPAPAMTLFYNADIHATEVRLDGVAVAMVRMRQGHGPLRASAIKLVPDMTLAAQMGHS